MPRDIDTSAEQDQHTSGLMAADQELLENIVALVASGQEAMVTNILADLYPADVAQILEHLPGDYPKTVFQLLPVEIGGDVLPELEDDFRAQILGETRPLRIAALLDEMDTDDAADVIADLPENVVEKVLPKLEDSEDVGDLLAYDEDSAGGIMGTELVVVPHTWSVADVTEEVRRNAEQVEPIYAVFVQDESNRLIGAVSLKRLLLSPAGAPIQSVIDTDNIAVRTNVDQEKVARVMEKYDMVSLPVVDDRDRVIGRITIDDVVDVIREEAEEDIQRMSGVAGNEGATDSAIQISRGRLPWLFAGMIGAGLSAYVIWMFEDSLRQAVVLASFIPIVMATAGNAGIQSSAIAVQGLASGDVWSSDVLKRFAKELIVSIINGFVLAAILGLVVMAIPGDEFSTHLAITAGLTMVVVVILATTIGATVPLLLHRFGVDPAIATGPFITTTNDILGIIIFFVLATLIYLA